jgi:GTP diphosphokinase / guanosine-3',5'-bis(diphosphate) 3'-diphosphatase
MNEFIRALTFAAAKHRDQRRKDPTAAPYINHPIAVADVLANEAEALFDEVYVRRPKALSLQSQETPA